MTSVVTDNQTTPNEIRSYRAPKARGKGFTKESSMRLITWILKQEPPRFPRRNKKASDEEKKVMWELWLERRKKYKKALEDVLIGKNTEANQECIAWFQSIQQYLEHHSQKSMLELDQSPWWKKNIVPLLKQQPKTDGVVEAKEDDADDETKGNETRGADDETKGNETRGETQPKKQDYTPSKIKKYPTDEVTDAMEVLNVVDTEEALQGEVLNVVETEDVVQGEVVEDRQKYYTREERIEKCIDTIAKSGLNIDRENDLIVEPSAGDGRWIPYLKKLCNNVVAYDIEPDNNAEGVQKRDFLSQRMYDTIIQFKKDYRRRRGRVHIIGNPPWKGVEKKFLRQVTHNTMVHSVSFLLPASHMRADHLYVYLNEDGSRHNDTFHLPTNYIHIWKEFLKDEQYVGQQKKYLNTAFIIWRRDKSNRKPEKMPPKKSFVEKNVLAYEYLVGKNRSKANIKFYKGDAECECYNGEAIEDSRFYYFSIGEKILSWFWWRREFTLGVQHPEQKKKPEEYFVKDFNTWRKTWDDGGVKRDGPRYGDPFRERFYTLGKPSVSKYGILSNLIEFINEHKIKHSPSKITIIKKHMEMVTGYEAKYIYDLRKNILEYFIQHMENLRDKDQTHIHNNDLKLLHTLYELNEDIFKNKKISANFENVKKKVADKDIDWEKVEAIVDDDETYENIKKGEDFTEVLELYNLNEDAIKILAPALAEMTNLQELELHIPYGSDVIGAESCLYLAPALPKMRVLEVLRLDENNIGDRGCYHLAGALPKLEVLEKLYLANNNIGDKGCQHLAGALSKMKTLDQIALGWNNIGDKGCSYLGPALAQIESLRYLSLEKNNIADEGCSYLGPALAQIFLKELSLERNNICDVGCRILARYFSQMIQLNELKLGKNRITKRGEAKMIKAWQDAGKNEKGLTMVVANYWGIE